MSLLQSLATANMSNSTWMHLNTAGHEKNYAATTCEELLRNRLYFAVGSNWNIVLLRKCVRACVHAHLSFCVREPTIFSTT